MAEKAHPGDWLWFIAGGRMHAMTHDAYDLARRLVETQEPDIFEGLRARKLGTGELYKAAFGILEGDGEVRVERSPSVISGAPRVPVYAVAPPDLAVKVQQRRDKRARSKRTAPSGMPALVVVGGAAAE